MEENVRIRLSPKATFVTEETRTGVRVNDCAVWAKDRVQTALLGELRTQSKTVGELKRVARAVRDGPDGEAFDALALVDFILTFGTAIENSPNKQLKTGS